MSLNNQLNLLLKEIQDPYAQENFYRLKLYLENQLGSTGSLTQVINNITTGTLNAQSATKLKITRIAQEPILSQEVVKAYSDTHVNLATANLLRDNATVLGVSDNDAAVGENVDIILLGVVSNPAFSVFSLHDPLFLDVDGGITNVKRTTGFHTIVGECLGGNQILFKAEKPITLA